MNFIDSNVFLRYLTNDDAAAQDAAARVFTKLAKGEEEGFTTDVHIHEVAYVLASKRLYALSHEEIRNRLRPLLLMSGLKIVNKKVCLDALDIFAAREALDYADALAVASMRNRSIQNIYSFDKHFNRIEGVTRVDP